MSEAMVRNGVKLLSTDFSCYHLFRTGQLLRNAVEIHTCCVLGVMWYDTAQHRQG
jgi:hypothetical protein